MFCKNDEQLLRSLAREVKEASLDPINNVKREFWYRHTSLKGERPAVFVHPDGSWNEFLPYSNLECEDWYAKSIEYILRQRIFRHKYIHDDVPIEGSFHVQKVYYNSMWGVQPKFKPRNSDSGSWHHEPIIEKASDWKQLKMPKVEYDDAATKQRFEDVGNLLGDILELDYVGVQLFNFHMIHWYCDYRGLENMYMDLVLEPEMVHETIRFFTDGVISMFKQYEQLGLVSLNNDDTFHYTGGIGYNSELPSEGFNPDHVRLIDVWGAAEAQEFSSVSPEMHEEFILQYEREVLELFGLNGYGCCDDLSQKLNGVLKIKNLRRVAVCPWADISKFTPVLGDKHIMTWKPQPAYLAYDKLSTEEITKELNEGVKKANGGKLELILRDTHTVKKEPERFNEWIKIAREAIKNNWEG
ncbi:MAG: hypothetical protein A2Y17_07220 [Clostridiales bacterium GWF2_38_85]|nr:MAG: hypothetical protein A2Y17_07220 [Clostridiales bacterium GWF2_38_85]HBL85003.1 hypothetical protein [Clostridiales bacterium]